MNRDHETPLNTLNWKKKKWQKLAKYDVRPSLTNIDQTLLRKSNHLVQTILTPKKKIL